MYTRKLIIWKFCHTLNSIWSNFWNRYMMHIQVSVYVYLVVNIASGENSDWNKIYWKPSSMYVQSTSSSNLHIRIYMYICKYVYVHKYVQVLKFHENQFKAIILILTYLHVYSYLHIYLCTYTFVRDYWNDIQIFSSKIIRHKSAHRKPYLGRRDRSAWLWLQWPLVRILCVYVHINKYIRSS